MHGCSGGRGRGREHAKPEEATQHSTWQLSCAWAGQDGALLALCKQIIRGDGKGLEHVEALLALPWVPALRVLPAKRRDVARKGQMRFLVMSTLGGGLKPLCELAAHVTERRPEITSQAAYVRTTQAVDKLRRAGLVRREERQWGLSLQS